MLKTVSTEYLYINQEIITNIPDYPIRGNLLTRLDTNYLYTLCQGRQKYGDCLFQATIAQNYLKKGKIILGSCFVYSIDNTTNYGFSYDPPFEGHAWLQNIQTKEIRK